MFEIDLSLVGTSRLVDLLYRWSPKLVRRWTRGVNWLLARWKHSFCWCRNSTFILLVRATTLCKACLSHPCSVGEFKVAHHDFFLLVRAQTYRTSLRLSCWDRWWYFLGIPVRVWILWLHHARRRLPLQALFSGDCGQMLHLFGKGSQHLKDLGYLWFRIHHLFACVLGSWLVNMKALGEYLLTYSCVCIHRCCYQLV